ncbi:HD domain-containing protein [Mumia sp. zg.B53]|nr:HD domain-containing protein [Mumia sp. zg.B53]
MVDDLIITGNPFPDGIDDRLSAQLAFIAEADKLKTIVRASPLAAADRRENDAEHSWHLALMVMLLAEHATEPIDVGHTLRLVIIHDLVEIYAGDSPVFDAASRLDQREREESAADRLFPLLPADQAQDIRMLWDEFEAGATPEARFAKAIDRLEPMVLNWFNEGGTWRMPGANLATIRARESGVVAGSTALGDATGMLVDEGLRRGWIRGEASEDDGPEVSGTRRGADGG